MSEFALFEALERRALFSNSVAGVVFNDLNADHARESAEPGLAHVRVYLDANNNHRFDSAERSTLTDSAGRYHFDAIADGYYIVRQSLQAGWRQTTPRFTYGQHVLLQHDAHVTGRDFGQTFATQSWSGFANDPQHTALSDVASQSLDKIHWRTTIDTAPQFDNGELLIHYGSPVITSANTVIIPIKTKVDGGFRIDARSGVTGKLLWSIKTDYVTPPHLIMPSYSVALGPNNRLYFAQGGGTVGYIDNVDSAGAKTVHRVAFYDVSKYAKNKSAFDAGVFVDTPITIDAAGNLFFGVEVADGNPLDFPVGGVARISSAGAGTFLSATDATGDPVVRKAAHDSAPALSNDGKTLYIAINKTIKLGQGAGIISGNYLLALDAATLKVKKSVRLKDPISGNDSDIGDGGTASPVVGPDGDVYFGVNDSPPQNHYRGFLLHFDADLTQQKPTGDFGWDDTPSIVPKSMVPSYHGSSKYLIMTKYNDYADVGGTGINKIAILDPNATQKDPATGVTVMKEVLTIAGVTPDPDHFPQFPHAVKEWCINTAAVDPATDSVLVNSEDGVLYRWNLATNTFTQKIRLTAGLGEAYTPTAIGSDGTVFAINDATLFAVGDA